MGYYIYVYEKNMGFSKYLRKEYLNVFLICVYCLHFCKLFITMECTEM